MLIQFIFLHKLNITIKNLNRLKMITEKIINLISKKLKISNSNITKDTQLENIENWDSLNHAVIISSLEDEFNLSFDLDEIIDFETINDISIAVSKKHTE